MGKSKAPPPPRHSVPVGRIVIFTAAEIADRAAPGTTRRQQIAGLLRDSGVPLHEDRCADESRKYDIRDLIDAAHVGHRYDGLYHFIHWFPHGTVIP